MELVDTHCHIHSADYGLDADEVIRAAAAEGVTRLICVGTDLEDSRRAVEFASNRDNCWSSVGIHPHEADRIIQKAHGREQLKNFGKELGGGSKIVAVGECGLDYYYNHSSKRAQAEVLRWQLEFALEHNLPLIFHIREAYADFWSIFDEYYNRKRRVQGVVHSFSATRKDLDEILARDLYVGLNGIMTFIKQSKQPEQIEAAKMVPLRKLLLETDAPYLTPVPYRGKICEPKHARVTAEFLADLRGESLERLATATTANAKQLFGL